MAMRSCAGVGTTRAPAKGRMVVISVLTVAMLNAAAYASPAPRTQAILFTGFSQNQNQKAPARSTPSTIHCQLAPTPTPAPPDPLRRVVVTAVAGVPVPIFNNALTITVKEVSDGAVAATVDLAAQGSCTLGPAEPGAAYAYQEYIIQVDNVLSNRAAFIVYSTRPVVASKPLTYLVWMGVGFVLLLIIYLVVAFAKKVRLTADQPTRRMPVGTMTGKVNIPRNGLTADQRMRWMPVWFTLLLMIFLIVTFFWKEQLTPDQRNILRFLCALCAGFSGFSGALITGEALFKMTSSPAKGTKFAASGTAGFALFFAVWFTFPLV